jgi:undecaprenyl diphosphate synthase
MRIMPVGLHLACIMDGNGRWAKRRGLPRTAGHTAGEEALAEVVRVASRRNVGWLTVFGFSTENWVRPPSEVRHILGLHRKLFGRIEELNANNVRVNWIGRPFDEPGSRTPGNVQKAIRQAIEDTKHNTGMVLTVAFDYGSRAEIARAAKHARRTAFATASEGVAGAITPHDLEAHLYDPALPPVDVLVRTSGETRVSNFMLWQSAGARVYFTDCSWPDFGAAEIDEAIALARPRSA